MASRDYIAPSSYSSGDAGGGDIGPASGKSTAVESLREASSLLGAAAPFTGIMAGNPAVDMLKAVSGGGGIALAPGSHFVAATSAPFKYNIQEREGGYEICIDCPGMSRDDFHINVEGSNLIVRAQKGLRHTSSDGTFEAASTSEQQVIPLPPGIDTARLNLQGETGCLRIFAPRV